MSAAGQLLLDTRATVNTHGLTDGDHPQFADTTGRLDLVAAVFVTATGKTPACFTHDTDLSQLLIETNEPVMTALRWISTVLPTEAPADDLDAPDDVIEHIAGWLADRDPFLGRRPGPADVIGVLERAAAEAGAPIPRQRTAA